MLKATKSLLLLVACCACLSIPVLAQTTGSISGQVKDEKGAILPNATVTLRNVATNLSRTAQTDDEGRYRFSNVEVGEYEISVEAAGFAKHDPDRRQSVAKSGCSRRRFDEPQRRSGGS